MSLKTFISVASAAALPIAGMATLQSGTASFGQAGRPAAVKGASPALCGPGDMPEPGIQGDVPAGVRTGSYNCGVRLVGQIPQLSGTVQGIGKCAYVRTGRVVNVIDVSDPAKPVNVRNVPYLWGSESFRIAVAKDRAVLVSGSSVYDIKDCLNPVLKGEIKWPPLNIGIDKPLGGGGGTGILPHDIRINHAGTKVYGSLGLWEVDISNLDDPNSWKVNDLRCDILQDIPGPWQEPHRAARRVGNDLCEDMAKSDAARGANWRLAGSSAQTSVLWPQLSHGPAVGGTDKYVYIGDQAGGTLGKISNNKTYLHVVDVSRRPAKVVGRTDGPGHSVDWFQTGGRQYVLHANEIGSGTPFAGTAPARGAPPAGAAPGAPARGGVSNLAAGALNTTSDTCKHYPRPTALGWAFDAVLTDVTDPTRPRNINQLRIAINNPEHCAARKASGKDPSVAYHMIDDPMNAHFAMVNFGSAGLRIFDIRNPGKAVEVAYYNHGPGAHSGVGYYDAARGLIYAGGAGFWVLELEPQVRAKLGLK